jgi:transcriptional regulator with XRE-family HTH domain
MGKFTFRGYYRSQDQIPEPVSFLTGANLARPFAAEGPRCPACGGELVALGNLGAVAWSRCRDCGIITGANLRRLRLERGLTLQRMSNLAGISISGLAGLESGAVPDPRLNTVRKLARVLGVDINELAGDDVSEGTFTPDETPEVREPPPARKPGRRPKGGAR